MSLDYVNKAPGSYEYTALEYDVFTLCYNRMSGVSITLAYMVFTQNSHITYLHYVVHFTNLSITV